MLLTFLFFFIFSVSLDFILEGIQGVEVLKPGCGEVHEKI